MARLHSTPVSNVRQHSEARRRSPEGMMVVLCTALFIAVGALIAITQVLPTLH
ncbi:MAG: hypothetical protein JWM76_2814 [Pseudonocardiales bacterium]|nr:hypothetical protein [Pseudonocardiales bacterium]